MKAKLLLSLLLLLASTTFCVSQNLVPNPSFEEKGSCPTTSAAIESATSWISTRNTPNYFNFCAPTGSDGSVPCNLFGCQYAASGDAYGGFWAKAESSEYREHLGIPLISHLQAGLNYFVSFKVSLATSPYPFPSQYCGVNKIGALFSTVSYNTSGIPSPINNYAQVYTNNIVTDTANWILVKGSFIADSAYSFISIGNFFDNSFTDSIQLAGDRCQAYYYVDDICVSTDSTYAYNYVFTGLNENSQLPVISVYPNPTGDYINIDYAFRGEPYDLYIYDDLGREVFVKVKSINSTDHIPVSNIGGDALFVKIISDGNTFNYTLIKL